MSTAAAQLILHPHISQTVKLWASTAGRDKTYRAIQYFARFFAWWLLSKGYDVQAARWNALKSSLGSGRKLMRLFKPIEHLQAALKASQSPALKPYAGEQFLTVAKQISYAGYLSFDAIVWANSVRFLTLNPEKASKALKTSLRFWLAGILFSVVQGLLKASRLANSAKKLSGLSASEKAVGEEAERQLKLKSLALERGAVRYQLIIDLLDFWLPASGLALVNVNDGLVGICGFITSVMALKTQWAALNKS